MWRRMFTNNRFSFSNKIVSQCGVQSCFDEHWPLRHTHAIIIFVINFHNVNNTVSTVHISFRDWFRHDMSRHNFLVPVVTVFIA